MHRQYYKIIKPYSPSDCQPSVFPASYQVAFTDSWKSGQGDETLGIDGIVNLSRIQKLKEHKT